MFWVGKGWFDNLLSVLLGMCVSRPERTSTKHSWNGNWLLTNSVIFRLQRHSDHHAYAARPYQVQAPQSWSLML